MKIQGLVPQTYFTSEADIPVIFGKKFPLLPGDERILEFLNSLSKKILSHPELKRDPAYAALGFWLRKASLGRILKENKLEELRALYHLKPVGLVFHLCPSNVDTMFFYSLTLALMGGNKNLIRVSSRLEEPAVFTLFELINELVRDGYPLFGDYISIVSYERDDAINEAFSRVADGRIIWGGDETIAQFKKYGTKFRVKDLYFADRTSLSVINAGTLIQNPGELGDLCKKLYTDIYTFDQMGCSSPHCLFLIGTPEETKSIADSVFQLITELAREQYDRDMSSMASFKLNRSVTDILDGVSTSVRHDTNFFIMAGLQQKEIPHSCGMGYVYYKSLEHLEALLPYINEKVQTLGVAGFEKESLQKFMALCPPNALDRIVPIGKALDFDYIWDGYNIFLELINFKSIR